MLWWSTACYIRVGWLPRILESMAIQKRRCHWNMRLLIWVLCDIQLEFNIGDCFRCFIPDKGHFEPSTCIYMLRIDICLVAPALWNELSLVISSESVWSPPALVWVLTLTLFRDWDERIVIDGYFCEIGFSPIWISRQKIRIILNRTYYFIFKIFI